MRHAASVLLAVGLALSLTACTGAREEPAAGRDAYAHGDGDYHGDCKRDAHRDR